MRLTQIQLEGFRAFGRSTALDFAADVVLLVGPNGSGKTSLFDAIEWALFGSIPRLRGNRDAVGDDYVANRFMPGVQPQVSLYLTEGDKTVAIRRASRSIQVLDDEGDEISGTRAEAWIRRHAGNDDDTTLAGTIDVFERTNLLGQDRMVDFVRDTNPRDRFDSLSTLLGADVVRRFYHQVDRWLAEAHARETEINTDSLQAERTLEQLRLRRLALDSDAQLAPDVTTERLDVEMDSLRRQLAGTGLRWPVDATSRDLAGQVKILSDIVRQSDTQRSRAENALKTITNLEAREAEVERQRLEIPRMTESVESQDTESRGLRARLASETTRLAELENALTETRRSLTQVRRDKRDLAQFLTLARRHVTGDRCPVCEQPIIVNHVIERLDERVKELPAREVDLVSVESRQARAVEDGRETLALVESEIKSLRSNSRKSASRLAEARRTVEEWDADVRGVLSDWSASSLQDASIAAAASKKRPEPVARRATELISEAKSAQAQLGLKELDASQAAAEVAKESATQERVRLRAVLADLAKLTSDAKASEVDIVQASIEAHMPTLQAVYRRLNPSALFDALDIRFGRFNERGEVYYRASHGQTTGNASMMFSSAQMNAVAVSVFLALNLMRPSHSFDWILLDDPIQSMDDYNVLGLVDLLRALRGTRQLVVSTHDQQLGDLMKRKLRPHRSDQRTVIHRFEVGNEEGPRVLTTAAEGSETELVLASAG